MSRSSPSLYKTKCSIQIIVQKNGFIALGSILAVQIIYSDGPQIFGSRSEQANMFFNALVFMPALRAMGIDIANALTAIS
jgi:hypothetical protein